MSDTSDVHKLTGAYAVDAVDELERARFEQHLAECEDCRAEVAELRETAALLAEDTAVAPPAALRESVLAGISQVRPLPPEVRAPAPRATHEHRAGRRAWMPFLVAAALAVLVGIGALIVQPWAGEDDVKRLTAAEQVLQADDAQEVFLDLGEAGRATVTRSKSHDRAVISTEDMVAAPDGKDYELWLMSPDGAFTSAGLMPDEADQTLVLDGSAADAAAVGITVEPDGGSKQPTSDPIALFDLTEAA
ncbi:anti-sigma-K factor RskA [Nocardioides cavernae]|uniref:Regulator of SigK n=1 Tax=Nocardioides cavernae TaxID=1921566 RepID=A0A7Y9H218_9ACTN|nr:anti-sigma factor [Nocardioides cavernae]NYE36514.1 anti-sigma-K factor RskA [Nocardioides cavernae]